MIQFPKPDCPVLADLTYVFQILIVVILLLCASHITCSHTQNCCTYQMHRYRGELSWISLKGVQNGISKPNLNSIQYAHI
jgi:hypothetical protein